MILTVTIPLRIVSEANSSEPWPKKAKRHKQQKMLVKAYLPSVPFLLPCTVMLIRHAPRPFDDDNLQTAFKYIRDAVASWFVELPGLPGQADSDPRITWKYVQKKTKDKQYYITIQVETDKSDTSIP